MRQNIKFQFFILKSIKFQIKQYKIQKAAQKYPQSYSGINYTIMIILLYLLIISIVLVVYMFAVKPYMTVLKLKKQFQSKGYKVYVEQLNFFKQSVINLVQTNAKQNGDALIHLKTKYQGYDVTIHNVMNKVFVWINGLEIIKQAYQKIQFLQKSTEMRNNFIRLSGGGLVMSEGKQWKEKRRLYSEIFNFKLLQEIHPNIQQITHKTCSNQNLDKQLDVLKQLKKLLFNCFVVSYFGCQFQGFSYKNHTYSDSLCRVFDQLFHQTFDIKNILFGTKILEKGLTKTDREIQQLLNVINTQTKTFVVKRFQEILEKQEGSENNILSKLVFNKYFTNVSEEEKAKKLSQIVGDVLIFFFAGTDTTSDVLTVTLHMLCKHPQIKQKLLAQLKQIKLCNYQTIKQLKYMDAVMNQTLRLYGPANWIFLRQTHKNHQISLGGVPIPQGAYIAIQSMTIHCSKQYYQNPLQFIPQRWMDRKSQTPFSFVSFGAGQRNCIGQHLARNQYKTILSYILRNYQFSTFEQFKMGQPFTYQSLNNKFKFVKKGQNFVKNCN